MLYVIFSFLIILLWLKFQPTIDWTREGEMLLWYCNGSKRDFIILKKK